MHKKPYIHGSVHAVYLKNLHILALPRSLISLEGSRAVGPYAQDITQDPMFCISTCTYVAEITSALSAHGVCAHRVRKEMPVGEKYDTPMCRYAPSILKRILQYVVELEDVYTYIVLSKEAYAIIHQLDFWAYTVLSVPRCFCQRLCLLRVLSCQNHTRGPTPEIALLPDKTWTVLETRHMSMLTHGTMPTGQSVWMSPTPVSALVSLKIKLPFIKSPRHFVRVQIGVTSSSNIVQNGTLFSTGHVVAGIDAWYVELAFDPVQDSPRVSWWHGDYCLGYVYTGFPSRTQLTNQGIYTLLLERTHLSFYYSGKLVTSAATFNTFNMCLDRYALVTFERSEVQPKTVRQRSLVALMTTCVYGRTHLGPCLRYALRGITLK